MIRRIHCTSEIPQQSMLLDKESLENEKKEREDSFLILNSLNTVTPSTYSGCFSGGRGKNKFH